MNDFERQYAIRLPNGELFTYPKPESLLPEFMRPPASARKPRPAVFETEADAMKILEQIRNHRTRQAGSGVRPQLRRLLPIRIRRRRNRFSVRRRTPHRRSQVMTRDEALEVLKEISETDKALSREINRTATKDSFDAKAVYDRRTYRYQAFERLLDVAMWAVAGSES